MILSSLNACSIASVLHIRHTDIWEMNKIAESVISTQLESIIRHEPFFPSPFPVFVEVGAGLCPPLDPGDVLLEVAAVVTPVPALLPLLLPPVPPDDGAVVIPEPWAEITETNTKRLRVNSNPVLKFKENFIFGRIKKAAKVETDSSAYK